MAAFSTGTIFNTPDLMQFDKLRIEKSRKRSRYSLTLPGKYPHCPFV
jgi:hypothetical protein